ncbi:inorganic diphosphatase [Enterobacteriaceae endosymbiont of Macroplea appendiculata]|uniref:inorganic diphosphatase n=1 Tax=Enterobacteriaceae endosymbiont of Macroplea appendiculata TaxID=2675790 RepID=UPI00144939C6|nr:inorganic diphosphatase [Enterobacteriaceae endosymbiont of Macroplea appendiculata]QJC31018.1 inorganic diphosphatase [Enterobacteriaceae endosymbiont of Macroplea appendiculata]
MNLNNIPAGNNIPHNINVIVEISINTNPVKYEINKKYGLLFVDRFISTTMIYPCNYGYINQTLSLDNDPLDVLIFTEHSILPSTVIECRPIGLLKMFDESGEDKKILAVPCNKISLIYQNIKNISDVPDIFKNKIVHFFQHYKDLEKNKWSKIDNWYDIDIAKKEIIVSINRFHNK